MRNQLLSFLLILFAVFIVFSLLDRDDYAIEKRLWRIEKDFAQIAQDPKVIPDQQYERIASRYANLIQRYPKSQLAPKIQIQIARLYVLKKDFVRARAVYGQVLNKYPSDRLACSSALLGMGATYEQQGDSAKALNIYRDVFQRYPETDIGMTMPLYIVNYYLRLNKNTEADDALNEAQRFYENIIDHKSTADPEKFNALRLLAMTYMAEEQWGQAVNAFSRLLLDKGNARFLNAQRVQLVLRSINMISLEKLKDTEQPILIYQSFIEKNPGHPLNSLLKEMIGALRKAKIGASESSRMAL